MPRWRSSLRGRHIPWCRVHSCARIVFCYGNRTQRCRQSLTESPRRPCPLLVINSCLYTKPAHAIFRDTGCFLAIPARESELADLLSVVRFTVNNECGIENDTEAD